MWSWGTAHRIWWINTTPSFPRGWANCSTFSPVSASLRQHPVHESTPYRFPHRSLITLYTSECIRCDWLSYTCWSRDWVLCQARHGTKRESALPVGWAASICVPHILTCICVKCSRSACKDLLSEWPLGSEVGGVVWRWTLFSASGLSNRWHFYFKNYLKKRYRWCWLLTRCMYSFNFAPDVTLSWL